MLERIYDANNTGYYSNPGDTSRMNQIRANTYYSPYSGSDSNLGRSSYPYGWGFQEDGSWSNPYPDLVLQYHTGITMLMDIRTTMELHSSLITIIIL